MEGDPESDIADEEDDSLGTGRALWRGLTQQAQGPPAGGALDLSHEDRRTHLVKGRQKGHSRHRERRENRRESQSSGSPEPT